MRGRRGKSVTPDETVYSEKELSKARDEAYEKGRADAARSMRMMKTEETEKTYTAEEFKKAMHETYALAYQHGLKKAAPASSVPGLQGKIAIETLSKALADNARKINDDILAQNRKTVKDHMAEWSKDTNKALDEVLAAAKLHDETCKGDCGHGH